MEVEHGFLKNTRGAEEPRRVVIDNSFRICYIVFQ